MTDNVTYSDRFSTDPRAEKAGEQRMRHLARLREIEGGKTASGGILGKSGYKFTKPSDRIIAARAIGALVRQAKERNVTVERIKETLPGSARLDRYKLSPDIDADTAMGQSKKLQQRVLGYLQAAETIAHLTNQNSDELKIQVLIDTSLWSQPSAATEAEDPRAEHLARELIEMGHCVARRTKLQPVLERATRIPGQWDLLAEQFLSANKPCLSHDAFLGWDEHWTEAPPLPSVPLVRCVHAVFTVRVLIETEGRTKPLAGDLALSRDFEGSTEFVNFELAREIRLALAPSMRVATIGPMFESRAHVSLLRSNPEPELCELRPNISLKPVDDVWAHVPPAVFQVRFGDLWHRVATMEAMDEVEGRIFDLTPNAHPMRWACDPLDPNSLREHWYVSWAPITADSVAHWFDRPIGTNTTVAALYEGLSSGRPVWYPLPGLAAHEIERGLANGGLELALMNAVARVKEALVSREADWLADAAAEHSERIARWQEDL